MDITDVRIELVEQHPRLRGFVSIVLDNCFLVRDIRIIEGPNGLILAMPSRHVMRHCPKCNTKNALNSQYCNYCGDRLVIRPLELTERAFADVAHPVTTACRQQIERAVLAAYRQQLRSETHI